jgi:hypothetical protein
LCWRGEKKDYEEEGEEEGEDVKVCKGIQGCVCVCVGLLLLFVALRPNLGSE